MKIKIAFLFAFTLLIAINIQAQTPVLNQNIIKYVASQIGKQVDRGECWDLAYEALTRNKCDWDGKYGYGKKLNLKTDTIYVGDIIQFTNVTIKYTVNGTLFKEIFKHHTAIVYEVIGPGNFKIAHQNNGFSGKKVGISELKLSNKTTGTIEIYRPQPKA